MQPDNLRMDYERVGILLYSWLSERGLCPIFGSSPSDYVRGGGIIKFDMSGYTSSEGLYLPTSGGSHFLCR